jgi:hypothetical protein
MTKAEIMIGSRFLLHGANEALDGSMDKVIPKEVRMNIADLKLKPGGPTRLGHEVVGKGA